MAIVQQFVGLDYHDEVVQVCVMDSAGKMLENRACPNDASEIMAIVTPHGRKVRGVIEACCGAANLAEEMKWRRWLEVTPQIHGKMRWVIDRQLRRLEFLEKEIRIVERQLAQMTKDDPAAQKLLTVKGIGLITAATLRAEIGHFARFRTGKQLSRFY
ncbi:MAG: transposase [Thermoguttaceae bacterium]|jgi:transposase